MHEICRIRIACRAGAGRLRRHPAGPDGRRSPIRQRRCRRSRRRAAAPTTAEGARAFVAAVEKDLFDLSVIGSRAAWVNATYITDDTDALAAYFGTIGTEKGVKYALEAAQICRRSRASISTPRASSTSCAARSSCRRRRTPGAAAELNTIATRLQSTYGKGRGTLDGKAITGDDAEAVMGDAPQSRPSSPRCGQSWHDNVGAPMRDDYARMVEIANAGRQGARLSPTPARCGARSTT